MPISEAEIRRLSRNGAAMSGMLPYLEDNLAALARALDNRMMSAINAGTMTPELALEGWMERAAYAKLLKHFQSVVRMGENPTGQPLKPRN
jgi:hypothetical protein